MPCFRQASSLEHFLLIVGRRGERLHLRLTRELTTCHTTLNAKVELADLHQGVLLTIQYQALLAAPRQPHPL